MFLKKYIFLIVILLCPHVVISEILFTEDFDSQADWRPTGGQYYNCEPSDDCLSRGGKPSNWDSWRHDEYWTPDNTSGAYNTVRIDNTNPRGGTGKSLTVTNESESDSPDGGGGGWSADGMITKVFSVDQNEVFMRFYMRTQTSYVRHWILGFNGAQVKVFRIMHWDRSGSIFSFFSTGTSCPVFVGDTLESEYGAYLVSAFRCDPQLTNYYCDENYGIDPATRGVWVDEFGDPVTGWTDEGGNSDSLNLGIYDGNWHMLVARFVLNTSPGVKDGIYQLYQNGYLISSVSDVAWIGTGGDIDAGFNTISFGGNAYNNWLGITDGVYQSGAEQWYAIDDIVIATTYTEAVNGPSGTPPTNVISTTDDQTVTISSFTIQGTATATSGRTISSVTIAGETVTADDGAFDELEEAWTCNVTLPEGENVYTAIATDSEAENGDDSITVTYTPPINAIQIKGATIKGCSFNTTCSDTIDLENDVTATTVWDLTYVQGQSFLQLTDGNLSKIGLYINVISGTESNNLELRFGNDPNLNTYMVNKIISIPVGGGYIWYEFEFDNDVPIYADTTYYFGVTTLSGGTILIGANNDLSYSGGRYYTDQYQTSWVMQTLGGNTWDLLFKIYLCI